MPIYYYALNIDDDDGGGGDGGVIVIVISRFLKSYLTFGLPWGVVPTP